MSAKELATEELDYNKAVRDDSGRVIDLSDGQRLMLRAGLSKLDLLAASFAEVADFGSKSPKMLVVCEDTDVAPQVAKFLRSEGLGDMLEYAELRNDEAATLTGRLV